MKDLPETMHAFVMHEHGGWDAQRYHTGWPMPQVGPDDVLIQVGACGLNNTDVNTRTGWYSKSVTGATGGGGAPEDGTEDPSWGGTGIAFPRIQGADAVGRVVALGRNTDPALKGKRVMVDTWLRDWDDPGNYDKSGYFGSERDGGFAQFTATDHRNVGIITCDLTDAELATFSCSYSTAEGMLARANVGAADRVLVSGASGGVGSALVQLAKRRGAEVIALASAVKHDSIRDLGADAVLDRAPEDLADALRRATGTANVTVVCDVVGGDYWPQMIDVMARGGRYACSGAIAGPMVDLDLRTLYLRDLTFHGSTFVPPEVFADLMGYINRGEIRPLLAQSFALSDLQRAQEAFLEKAHVGNIVVIPDGHETGTT